jgi:hypothetical protein
MIHEYHANASITGTMWRGPVIKTSGTGDIHVYMGSISLFIDSAMRNALALALVQHMYDTDGADRDTLDTLAHLTMVMSDNSGYEAAAADTLYDQFVDDAITGV